MTSTKQGWTAGPLRAALAVDLVYELEGYERTVPNDMAKVIDLETGYSVMLDALRDVLKANSECTGTRLPSCECLTCKVAGAIRVAWGPR